MDRFGRYYDQQAQRAWEKVYQSAGLPEWAKPYAERYVGPLRYGDVKRAAKRVGAYFGRSSKRRSTSQPLQARASTPSVGSGDRMSISESSGNGSGDRSMSNYGPRNRRPKQQAGFVNLARSNVVVGKKKRKGRAKSRTLKKRVAALERYGPKLANHDYRRMDVNYVANSVNSCAYRIMSCYNASIRQAAIDDLPYIDRGATPALDSLDLTNLGVKADISFRDIYIKLTVRNNNSIASRVDVYLCRAKMDSSFTPITALTTADAKYGITNADTNVMTFPSDFDIFKTHFKIVKHVKHVLQAGDELIQTYSQKSDKYDPEYVDDVSETYIKGDLIWLIRIQGILSHDVTTEENVGLSDGQVDLLNTMKMKVRYPSDAPFKKIETNVNLDTLTDAQAAGPVVDSNLQDDHN